MTTGSLLAFFGGMLVKELLATIGLLAVMTGAIVEEAFHRLLVTSCHGGKFIVVTAHISDKGGK